MGFNKTLTHIKSLMTESKTSTDDELMLSQLGVDKDTFKKLEEATLEATKENLKIKIKYVNKSDNEDLSYKYIDDSGIDLRANLSKMMILKSGERALIPTGLYFELSESMEIQVRPRSGLAIKNGITVLNTPGTVDRGYNGEIKVILINLGEENFTINHGDRIAQAVVSPVISGRWAKLIKVESLSNSSRGDGGFGSTGTH